MSDDQRKLLADELFWVYCWQDEMTWALQHGSQAEFDDAKIGWREQLTVIAPLVKHAPIYWEDKR